MSLDFDTTDTRTRRFKNAGNSCYINATLQALFAVPPVQRLYGGANLNRLLSGGCKRDDGQIDVDLSMAITYREARSASKKLEPMYPQIFFDNFYDGNQDDASVFFQQFSNSHRCVAPRLVEFFEGRDRPLGKCGTCAQSRTMAGFEKSQHYLYLCKPEGICSMQCRTRWTTIFDGKMSILASIVFIARDEL